MPGGPKEAYDMMEPILTKCAAKAGNDDEPCTGYLGPVGAGNYVKMVHNGIEYGDMQLIGEVYDILRTIVGYSNEQMAALFEEWNTGDLESFLIEITAKILAKKDDVTGLGNVVDYILDKTGMKVCVCVFVNVVVIVGVSADNHSSTSIHRELVAGLSKKLPSRVLPLPPFPHLSTLVTLVLARTNVSLPVRFSRVRRTCHLLIRISSWMTCRQLSIAPRCVRMHRVWESSRLLRTRMVGMWTCLSVLACGKS